MAGIDSAKLGMLAAATWQDVVANNLANVSTPGFKRDRVSFEALVAALGEEGTSPVEPVGVEMAAIVSDFSQGPLRATGNPLDLAISGEGFFRVMTPDGEAYTRGGSFRLSAEGQIVDASGRQLLGEGGPVTLPRGEVQIADDGTVSVDGVVIDKLSTVVFEDPSVLTKVGGNLYVANGAAPAQAEEPARILQGYIEGSNVAAVREMVDMISALRLYEANQKAVTSIDHTLEIAVGQVGEPTR